MTKYTALLVLAGLAACDDKSSDSGDTGGTPGGPPTIQSYDGTCLDDNTYFGELTTTSETSGVAVLNIWETGAPDDSAWNEEHDLVSSGMGSFGETLDTTLTKVDSVGAVNDDTTLFSCASGGQFQDENTLTYAIRIYDVDGNLAECGAFGHEPASVSNGSYTTIGGAPSNASQLDSCVSM